MSDDSGHVTAEEEVPPPNPQHVAWLSEGVESWNRRRKEEPFKPELTRVVFNEGLYSDFGSFKDKYSLLGLPRDFTGVDLSDADLRDAVLGKCVFHDAVFAGSDLTGAWASGADFTRADFRGAKLLELTAHHAKFDRAIFCDPLSRVPFETGNIDARMDPKNAMFNFCDLVCADFGETNLDGVQLTNCDLSDARLEGASMVGTSFGDSKLWRARFLADETGFESGKALDLDKVTTLQDLTELRRELLKVYASDASFGRVRFYFRGEPCARWSLLPTVMRGKHDSLRLFESELLTGLKTEVPAAFSSCEYAIDELAIARHFGLPARLLDITRNPLVGAFWATERHEQHEPQPWERELEGADCETDCACSDPNGECNGRLHVFAIPRRMVCAFDSDRVSVVANFARLSLVQQDYLLTRGPGDVDFHDHSGYDIVADWPRVGLGESMTTLLHNIRKEKPYFAPRIDIRDLFRVFVVEPRRSFDRIRAQSGAFMLSAFHRRFEGAEVAKHLMGTRLYDHHVLTIPADKKRKFREELSWFGINAQTLKADVESAAEAVTDRFTRLSPGLGIVTEFEDGEAWPLGAFEDWES